MIIEVDKLPDRLAENNETLLEFFRQHSKYHYQMLSLRKLGEGGESKVLQGDVPGVNAVIKIPLKNRRTGKADFKAAMTEAHIIEFVYDWLGFKEFVVEPREEIIVR